MTQQIPLLGSCLEKDTTQKRHMHSVLTAVLFTTARTWKQPKYPYTEEQIKKFWHACIMEYYSAINRNKIVPFAKMWVDLETVIKVKSGKKRRM